LLQVGSTPVDPAAQGVQEMKKLLRNTFVNGDHPAGRRVPEGGRQRNGRKTHSIKARALLIVVFLLIHLSVLSLLVEPVRAQEASFRIVSDASAKYMPDRDTE
jgi:hypothetical protein